MRLGIFCFAALLMAAPAADPELRGEEVRWFLLTETKNEVRRALGQPRLVADFGKDYLSWQYQIGNVDHEEYSHVLVFRKSEDRLISITRNYESERSVDALFPPGETTAYHYAGPENPRFSLRLRRLSGGRVLMAMGISKPGQVTGQLVLMRQAELRYFYPWLFEQLGSPE